MVFSLFSQKTLFKKKGALVKKIKVNLELTVKRKPYEFRMIVFTDQPVSNNSNPAYIDYGLIADEVIRRRNGTGITGLEIISPYENFEEIYSVFKTFSDEKIKSRILIRQAEFID